MRESPPIRITGAAFVLKRQGRSADCADCVDYGKSFQNVERRALESTHSRRAIR
jgi:hypothetical protein